MIRLHAWSAVLLAGALALAACSKPGQTGAAAPEDEAFHRQVVNYLADHPGAIQEGINAYNDKQHKLALAQAASAIAQRRTALEHDPRDYVANPQGKITVVEFFDYRCPYCKAALPQLEALIRENRDIRFVFKEMPVIPDDDGRIGVSLRAAEAALAAKRQGKYLQVHDALMTAPHLDDADIARILKENGVAAEVGPDDRDIHHVEDVRSLAAAIHANGTPNFVVGTTLIEGNRMDQLAAAIAEARKSVKS